MSLDRRSTLKALTASGLAATVGLPAEALAARSARPVTVVVFDGRYPECVAFAQVRAQAGVLSIDSRSRDLGLAWREEIAAHLARHPGRVEGLSLYADRFISAGMGREFGLAELHEARVPATGGAPQLFRWSLG